MHNTPENMDQALGRSCVKALLKLYVQSKKSPQISSEQRWDMLCVAHIAGQNMIDLHIQTHLSMLQLAAQERKLTEVFGQLFRLCLVPIGHLIGKLPIGNSGRANVSAFKPAAIEKRWLILLKKVQQSILRNESMKYTTFMETTPR